MTEKKYIRAESVAAASELLTAPSAAVYAGGTDLLGTIRERILPEQINTLVSLKGAGLRTIREEGDVLRIGAMTTIHEIETNAFIREHMAVLAEAARSIASPQIRHMATIGGNLCQQPRCWYYRHPDNRYECLRKGGRTCNAFTGNNTYHSIFGAMKPCDSACQRQCPNHTPIPAYFAKLREKDLPGAARMLLDANLLAPVMGRVCVHSCQEECSRNDFDENLSIRDIERYVGDYGLAHARDLFEKPRRASGRSVAIVGSGPAGLAAAWDLIRAGHRVTVFDAREKAGGMLRYGIPEYRLPRSILDDIVRLLEDFGVRFCLSTRLEAGSIAQLRAEHDGVLLCMGAWEAVRLGCPGEDLEGVWQGIDFLKAAAKHRAPEMQGKKTVVIGAGNTAMDAARTALRLGAASVDVISITDRGEVPATEEEMEGALEEGVRFRFLITAAQFQGSGSIAGGGEHLRRIRLQHTRRVPPEEGLPVPIEGAYEEADADLAIVAIGQRPEEQWRQSAREEQDNAQEGQDRAGRSAGGEGCPVLRAGDLRLGSRTAIEAIADGRQAAQRLCEMLSAGTSAGTPASARPAFAGNQTTFDPACLEKSQQARASERPPALRTMLCEDRTGLTGDQIAREVRRCFNCGCAAVSPSDLAAAVVSLGGVCITNRRQIPAQEFFDAGICRSTVLEPDEILTEIVLPKSAAGQRQKYQKFRLREAIDFPVMGLASNIFLAEDGTIGAVSLTASGAAPVPRRLTEAEELLIGKRPDAKLARAAAAAAVRQAVPLRENAYKIQVLRALVRRAVADAIRE